MINMETTQPINPRKKVDISQSLSAFEKEADLVNGAVLFDGNSGRIADGVGEERFVPPPYPPQPLSSDMIRQLSAAIKDRKIEILTHFTRLENLASILTHGLQPRSVLAADPRSQSVRFNPPHLPGYWNNALSFNISFPNYRLFYNLQEQMGFEWVVLLFDVNLLLTQSFYYFVYPAANLIQTPIFSSEISPFYKHLMLFIPCSRIRKMFAGHFCRFRTVIRLIRNRRC